MISNSSATIAAILDEIDAQAGTIIRDLEAMKKDLDEKVVDGKQMIEDTSAEARTTIDDFTKKVSDSMADIIITLKSVLVASNGYIDIASYAFFAPIFFSTIIGLFSVVAYLTSCKLDDKINRVALPLSWSFAYLFMILMFLLGGVILFESTVMTDACVIIKDMPARWDFYLDIMNIDSGELSEGRRRLQQMGASMAMAGDVLDGCFADPAIPVMETLNMSSAFDFDAIFDTAQLGDASGISEKFSIAPLEAYRASIYNMTLESFGLTPQVEQHVSDSGDADAMKALNEAKSSLSNTLSYMKDGIDGVMQTMNDLKAQTIAFDASMADVEEQLKPLIEEVKSIKNFGQCDFVKLRYDAMFEHLCVVGLGGSTPLGIIFVLLGITCIPIITIANVLEVRMFGKGQSAVTPADVSSTKVVDVY